MMKWDETTIVACSDVWMLILYVFICGCMVHTSIYLYIHIYLCIANFFPAMGSAENDTVVHDRRLVLDWEPCSKCDSGRKIYIYPRHPVIPPQNVFYLSCPKTKPQQSDTSLDVHFSLWKKI